MAPVSLSFILHSIVVTTIISPFLPLSLSPGHLIRFGSIIEHAILLSCFRATQVQALTIHSIVVTLLMLLIYVWVPAHTHTQCGSYSTDHKLLNIYWHVLAKSLWVCIVYLWTCVHCSWAEILHSYTHASCECCVREHCGPKYYRSLYVHTRLLTRTGNSTSLK